MRLGKRERNAFKADRLERLAVRQRALSVPEMPGRYASCSGKMVVTVPSKFNHTGWNSTSSRQIAYANRRKAA